MFDAAKLAVELAIGLIGILALWLGLFRIAEAAGLISWLAKLFTPLFQYIMPDVPRGHPAQGSITMNMAANMLGLDNAATPMGLQAMQHLQSINQKPDTATDAQILFLVLNTSSVTLLPVTIFMYRAQFGSADPTEVFLPIVVATSASTFAGILAVAWYQRINILHPVVMAYFFVFSFALVSMMYFVLSGSADSLTTKSSLIGNLILVCIVMLFLAVGFWKKVDLFETFVDGAKAGFDTAVRLIPYMVAMLVAIAVLRVSGAIDFFSLAVAKIINIAGGNTKFIDALPTALMKPLSGSGARAMMIDTINTYGVDSFVGRLAAVIQGSTETTFYVLAVYFGSVGIKKIRHALVCGLIADLAGILTAIGVCYLFF